MSIKKFGARDINLTGSSGTPNITSPTNINLNAQTVAISTDLSIGGEISSDLNVAGVATFQNTVVFDGSVGIGTSLPQGALEVIGDVTVNGTLNATDFQLPDITIGDVDENIFLGTGAGGNYDASTNNACCNVAIGYSAGCRLSEGDDNIFLGASAGACTNSGINNTFLGHCAGGRNAGGNNNFIAGFCAGYCGLNHSANILIGQFAGFKNAGYNNIFLGDQAGMCNTGTGTNASDNIFLGNCAGYRNVDGSHNIALGEDSGRSSENSSRNVTIGLNAGCSNFAQENVFIGIGAGRTKTNGSANTFLGTCAGFDFSSGGCNVLIGYNVEPPNSTGDFQFAVGANDNHWIDGDSNFNIGIGTGIPAAKLDVVGNVIVSDSVGIGTDNQTSKLQVNGTLGISASDELESVFPGGRTQLSSSASGFIVNHNDNSDTILQNQGSETLRITSGGDVGIGSTQPTETLDVLGNTTVSGSLSIGGTSNFLIDNLSPLVNIGPYQNNLGSNGGVSIFPIGAIKVNRPNGQETSNAWLGTLNGSITSRIYANGEAHFNGHVAINTNAVDATAALNVDGHVYPSVDNAHDLGSLTRRWRNIYTTDLQLSNEGKTNDVDGTWGKYTIQEGEEELYLINHRNGKKYKFMLQEVE